MDDYQREILEKALDFYERFALPQSRDPQVRLEAAHAGLRVGTIRKRLGNNEAAKQAYRQALAVLGGLVSTAPAELVYRDPLAEAHRGLSDVFSAEERWSEAEREIKVAASLWDALVREKPQIAPYRLRLADARSSLGEIYRLQKRHAEAEVEFRLALNAAELLAREDPDVKAYQESLAEILYGYGYVQQTRNDLAGSEASYTRAVAIMDNLARNHPEVTKYQVGLGTDLGFLGLTLAGERKLPQAQEAIKRSIAILEKVAADHPRDLKIGIALARQYHIMGDAFLLRGDNQSGLEWVGRAIQLYRSLAQRDPGYLRIRHTLLRPSLGERAENLTRLGRHAEALADFKEILEISQGEREAELFDAWQALTKARLGDRSALALLGDRVRDTVKAGAGVQGLSTYGGWMPYYDGACIHAALARLALEDQKDPSSERRRLADRDMERALELLDKARATGEFKGMIRLDEVRRESLLDPLRTNRRFQLLMMDLEFPANPFLP
jgi:tetratricopeptide (TPR) repeat protein